MAYGRLDVFYPNGDFATYLLDSPSVSVGRSAGCTIVLDTDTISRYHFSITHDGKDVKISDMDSANGTFVDGVQLGADESKALLGGEELQIGHLRMIYYTLNEDPTTFIDPVQEETQRYDRPDVGFSMEVYGSEIAIPPGSHTTVEISLTNMTSEEHAYTIEASGLPDGWGRLNRPTLTIEPDETAQIIYNIKPLRQSSSAPGDYPITFTIYQQDAPDKKLEGGVSVKILPYSGFGVALANPNLQDDESFRLFLLNQGSIPLPLTVSGYSADNALKFDIQQTQVTLAPGQRMEVRGQVRPKQRRLFGQTREYDFDLRVKSKDLSAFLTAVPAHYTEKAMLPTWAAYAMAGFGVVFAILMVIMLVILGQPPAPEPEILVFNVDKSQISEGDVVGLTWQANDIEFYDVLVNNDLVQTNISAETTALTVETVGYEGIIQIELIGRHGDKLVSSQQQVTIYPRLVVNSYTITPNLLTRNIVQEVRLTWDVDGAVTVTINNVPDETGENLTLREGLPPSGELVVPVFFTGSLEGLFLLTAYNDLTSLEMPAEYTLQDSECFTRVDGILARNYPSLDGQVVQTFATQNSSTLVNGRDASTTWLSIPLTGGGEAWIALADVSCVFDVNLLRDKSEQVPTATPTSTPTALPTIPTNTLTPVPAQSVSTSTSVPTATPAPTNTRVATNMPASPPTLTPITPTIAPTKTPRP